MLQLAKFSLPILLLTGISCTSKDCPSEKSFSVGPEGGSYEYCNWKFVVPPGTVSQTLTFTVQKSQAVSVKHKTYVALEHPQTGEMEAPIELELDAAPGFETIEFETDNPSAIVNAEKIGICPEAEMMVSERIGDSGSDTTATPLSGLSQKYPCFSLSNTTQIGNKPIYLSAAGTDWSDAWNRLLANSTELYNKYISGYTVVDPCVLCSYGGFSLASYLVPSDCQSFVKDQICTVTLPAIATALPLVLIPPLKQGVCAAAKAAIVNLVNFAASKVSSSAKVNNVCDLFDSGFSSNFPTSLIRDTFGCGFQRSCDAITSCSPESLQSKWIQANIQKCLEI
jgi:hypothetical protein